MITIKAKFKDYNSSICCFHVDSVNELIVLLQMLENNESCLNFRVFDSTQFEEIKSLKARFNISDTAFTKYVSVHPAVKPDVSVNSGAFVQHSIDIGANPAELIKTNHIYT